jgi:pSer/pThr/pTyr-binding forkhead associated (FHA) protein
MTLPSTASRAAEEKPAATGLQKPSGKLIILETGVELPLSFQKSELLIGRSDPARNIYPDVDLASHRGEAFGVSRAHARLVSQGLQIYIEDLNSTNFTFLNQKRLQPGQRYPLKYGDEIRLGLLAMKYLTG